MELRRLLSIKEVEDVIDAEDAIYVLVSKQTELPVYSDRPVHIVELKELPYREDLNQILGGTSAAKGQLKGLHGLSPKILYEYDTAHLPPTKRQQVSHALSGTGQRKSLLSDMEGEKVGRSALLVPPAAQKMLESWLDKRKVRYTKRRALMEDSQ